MISFTKIRRYPFWYLINQYRKTYLWGLVALLTVDVINVVLPLVIKEGVDALGPRDLRRIYWAAAIYFCLMALQSVGRYLWRVYLIGVSHHIARDLRLKLYTHLQKLPLNYYHQVRAGDLMSRATNDIESVRMALGPGILVTVDAFFMFVLIVPVMLVLSWKMSLLAFAFYPLVPLVTAKFGEKIDALFEDLQTRMSQMGAFAQETFAGIRLIKSLVLESHVHQRFGTLSHEFRKKGGELAVYEAAFSPSLGLMTNLGTFLILIVGGHDVLTGAISVGTFVAFQRFVVQLSWPMEAIGWAVTMNREGAAAHRRLDAVLEVPEAPLVVAPASEKKANDDFVLDVDNLKFHFDSQFFLEVPNLDLTSGSKIGLVGPVGAGKSTLLNLILRLYEPPRHTIYLGGRDVGEIPSPQLRQRIGSVEQQVFLFSESVEQNVWMGIPSELDSDRVKRALRTAAIWDEIQALPEKEKTPLGERGVNLSGGQKQRIALARALCRDPELLLLDDAFSAVDVEVENQIIHSLFRDYPHITVLFASHRLSVMSSMDQIGVLDKGKLIALAPHEQLLKSLPLYRRLWERSELRRERTELGIAGETGVEA